MERKIKIGILILLNSILNFQSSYAQYINGAKIVTYGEPCYASRHLPIKVQGPSLPVKEEKIPIKLDLRIIPEPYQEPTVREYPIAVEIPETPTQPLERVIELPDVLRGKTYRYNIKEPLIIPPPSPPRALNLAVEVPVEPRTSSSIVAEKPVHYLTGLKSKIDRVLLPACEVSSLKE